MLAGCIVLAGLGLFFGAGWLVLRTGRAWRSTMLTCQAALGGELTPGNVLLPPRLWLRTDDDLSLLVGLASSEGGRLRIARLVGGARSMVASTRVSVEGARLPGGITIYPAGPVPMRVDPDERQRVTLGIPGLDARLRLEGKLSGVLSRMGAERRAPIAAAVAQGASFDHGMWVIERAEPVVRASELIGLSRLLLAAARAMHARGTTAEERLLESVRRDPEPGFRMRCLESLLPRDGVWRSRALESGLSDPEPAIRLRAAQAAGAAGRPTLIALADSSADDGTRAAAITALANDDGPEVRALFEALALGGSVLIRAAALRGMRRVGHAPVALLTRFCRHPDPELRALALHALRPTGPPAESRAIDLLGDPAPGVVLAAVDVLAALGTISAIPALRTVRIGPLDVGLRAAVERARLAIGQRAPRHEVGQLALAGVYDPRVGGLGLDTEIRGQLSHGPDAPLDLFADVGPGAAPMVHHADGQSTCEAPSSPAIPVSPEPERD